MFRLVLDSATIVDGSPINVTATFENQGDKDFVYRQVVECQWLEASIQFEGRRERIAAKAPSGLGPLNQCRGHPDPRIVRPGEAVTWDFAWNGTFRSSDRGIWTTVSETHVVFVDFSAVERSWASEGTATLAIVDHRPAPPSFHVSASPSGDFTRVEALFNNTANRAFRFTPVAPCSWLKATVYVGDTSHLIGYLQDCSLGAVTREIPPGGNAGWRFDWNGTYMHRETRLWTPMHGSGTLRVDFDGGFMSWPSDGETVVARE